VWRHGPDRGHPGRASEADFARLVVDRLWHGWDGHK
jgi:hypothetical protein